MNGPRQIEIPPVVPGEPIGQTLLNSLIGAANNGRNISGDGGLNVSNIGGLIGISQDARSVRGNRGLLVQVVPPAIAPGFYNGKIYTQPVMGFASMASGSTTVPMSPYPLPNAVTCYVVNLAEVNSAYVGTAPSGSVAGAITSNRIAIGRFVGLMDSTGLNSPLPAAPLIAIDTGNGGNSTVTFQITGNESVSAMYTAKTFADTSTITLTGGTLTAASFGTLATSNNAIVLNTIEALGYSATGWDVTNTTNTFSTISVGRIVGNRSDGQLIIHATIPYTSCRA